jgi:hypothetical protein
MNGMVMAIFIKWDNVLPLLLQMHPNILKMVYSNLEFKGLVQLEEII